MVFKLVGNKDSTCTKRVAATLIEKKVPFELVDVDFTKGEHKAPGFVAKQPFGQVPYVEDDGFVLFESRAVARYVAYKYKDQGTPGLVPDVADLEKYGLFEQAMSIELSNYDPFTSKIVAEKIFHPMFGLPTDEKLVAAHAATLDAKLDAYEVILSKHKYIAGDVFTIADLSHLPYGTMMTNMLKFPHLTDEKRPNVARWWKEISARPSWLAVKDGVKGTA